MNRDKHLLPKFVHKPIIFIIIKHFLKYDINIGFERLDVMKVKCHQGAISSLANKFVHIHHVDASSSFKQVQIIHTKRIALQVESSLISKRYSDTL
jgi:hypothetical protein